MITEAQAIEFFAKHTFTKSVILLSVGSVAAYIKNDWSNFKDAQAKDPTLTFVWSRAGLMWLEGLVLAIGMAVAPALYSELLRILGASLQ